jgi:hypothetical protein
MLGYAPSIETGCKPLTKAATRALKIRQTRRLDAAAAIGFALLLSLLLLISP